MKAEILRETIKDINFSFGRNHDMPTRVEKVKSHLPEGHGFTDKEIVEEIEFLDFIY